VALAGECEHGTVMNELGIVPAHTADDPREVMASLVHEMLHFADYVAGTAPKSSGYHAKKWAARMEKIGLPPVSGPNKSRVAVSHEIVPNGPYARAYDALPKSILLPFVAAIAGVATSNEDGANEDGAAEKKRPTKAGKRFKYACPKCATTMRGPAGRKLICGDCEIAYIEEAPSETDVEIAAEPETDAVEQASIRVTKRVLFRAAERSLGRRFARDQPAAAQHGDRVIDLGLLEARIGFTLTAGKRLTGIS